MSERVVDEELAKLLGEAWQAGYTLGISHGRERGTLERGQRDDALALRAEWVKRNA